MSYSKEYTSKDWWKLVPNLRLTSSDCYCCLTHFLKCSDIKQYSLILWLKHSGMARFGGSHSGVTWAGSASHLKIQRGPCRWLAGDAYAWLFQQESWLTWQYVPWSECPRWTRRRPNGLVCCSLGSHVSLLPVFPINTKALMSAHIQGKVK